MNKIGFFGGSFDPIHFGHLIIAREIAEILNYDKIILVPSAIKESKISFYHRYEMCKKSVEKDPLFDVSDIEERVFQKYGNCYTYYTAKELEQEYNLPVRWIIGSDSVPELFKWYNQDGLKKIVSFVIAQRPGYPVDTKKLISQGFLFNIIQNPQIEISSSNIQQRLQENKSIKYLTPNRIIRYIVQNRLYGGPYPSEIPREAI